MRPCVWCELRQGAGEGLVLAWGCHTACSQGGSGPACDRCFSEASRRHCQGLSQGQCFYRCYFPREAGVGRGQRWPARAPGRRGRPSPSLSGASGRHTVKGARERQTGCPLCSQRSLAGPHLDDEASGRALPDPEAELPLLPLPQLALRARGDEHRVLVYQGFM